LTTLEETRNKADVDGLYKMQKENYELLHKYIDEVNAYSSELYEKLVSQVNLKADFEILEKFKSNVESKVLSDLKSKIDKIEHRRVQNNLRKKIDQLEQKVSEKQPDEAPPFFSKNNMSTCASCNRTLEGGGRSLNQDGGAT